jgi:hypothetical protein
MKKKVQGLKVRERLKLFSSHNCAKPLVQHSLYMYNRSVGSGGANSVSFPGALLTIVTVLQGAKTALFHTFTIGTHMPFKKGDPNINRAGRPSKGNAAADFLTAKIPPCKVLKLLEEFYDPMKVTDADLRFKAIRLYMEYVYGKPREQVENTIIGGDGGPVEIKYIRVHDNGE